MSVSHCSVFNPTKDVTRSACEFKPMATSQFDSSHTNRAALRRRRVAPVGRHHGIGVAILSISHLSVTLGSRNETPNPISTP